MKNKFRKHMDFRMMAAAALRKDGYEVYPLPDSPIKLQPHLVAYRDNSFFNFYLFESEEEREDFLTDELKRDIEEYAEAMNAKVVTVVVKLKKSGK